MRKADFKAGQLCLSDDWPYRQSGLLIISVDPKKIWMKVLWLYNQDLVDISILNDSKFLEQLKLL